MMIHPRFVLALLTAIAGSASIQADALAGESADAGLRQCEQWLKRTLASVESSPMARRRDVVVLATARSCTGIAEALQAAGASYAKVSSERMKAQILANGAAAVLKNNCANCSVTDPLVAAGPLVAACPLPGPDKKAHPDVPGLMHAADYAFLNALMKSLLAANEYAPIANRIVLDFIHSSAQLGEKRKAKDR
jgi:hypothetical protein